MTCAHCKFFTLKDLPAGAVDGEGQCIGFLESLQELVAWDRPICGIYRPANPMAPREAWILARSAGMTVSNDGYKTGLIGLPRRTDELPGMPGHPWRK